LTFSQAFCALLQVGNAIVLPGTRLGIQLCRSRPDVEAVLRAAAADTGAASLGVLAGGPRALMRAVHLAVCRLNGEGPAYYELHNETVEL
jgi:hypothetical protein